MPFSRLVESLDHSRITGEVPESVSGIAYDSRRVLPGGVFVAIRGGHLDGRVFIPLALERGASVVIGEDLDAHRRPGATFVEVVNPRLAMARAAAEFFGQPSRKLDLVGITGTNGKTTTAYLVRSILLAAGRRAGLIGTIEYLVGETVRPAPHTTPEAPDLQEILSDMHGGGMDSAVMEVSSHALDQYRADGCAFRVAVFTNLTQDHLDYHHTLENYYQAKRRLFVDLAPAAAVVNGDDPYGRRLWQESGERAIRYGIRDDAEVRASDIHASGRGLEFQVLCGSRSFEIRSPLVGLHNVYNILAATSAALALGVSETAIRQGVGSVECVAGRLEPVIAGQPFHVVVDYAHTPDALERVIEACRALCRGRLITVFGCGGDRDRSKRPAMGRVASTGSDLVLVTSDNPRSEDPALIITEIVAGMRGGNHRVIRDRREAIREAINLAKEDDWVLIAGKGHENYQEILGERRPFSDRDEARQAIAARMDHDRKE